MNRHQFVGSGFGVALRHSARAAALIVAAAAGTAMAANPLVSVLEDFEGGGTGGATPATTSNSSSTGATNSSFANVTDAGSDRLRMTDSDGTYNGGLITFPGAITQPGYYLITADIKVDNASAAVGSFGMAVREGGPSTAKISDVNAAYVPNLSGTGDAALGYQTIGAAINVTAGGSFPRDLTLYFGVDVSGNDFNASAFDGNYNGTHRGGLATWAAGSTNAVYIDNIKKIGPGNFGEERHLYISLGDNFTDLANLENILVTAKNNNFNCVDLLVRYRADAYYVPNRTDSTYFNPEPFGTRVGTKAASPTNDPLQYAVDRGHELGLKVFAVFSAFVATDGTSGTYPSFLPAGSQMWYYNGGSPRVMTGADPSAGGIWADISRQDVRDYTRNVLMDIVMNYDIDGVIIDRIRYPANSYSYNPQGLADIGISGTPSPTDAAFRAARQTVVTDFLQDVYENATSAKPWLIVGTVPIAFADSLVDTYNGVFQHWPKWTGRKTINRVTDFGVCDVFHPQFYRLWNSTSPFEAPAANTRLMNKAQYGDVGAYSLDLGLMPGAAANLAPLLYHPTAGDVNQSNANAQNITDGRALSMTGFGLYPSASTLPDMSAIRNPAASTAGADVLGSPATFSDYLFKQDYDNVAPNAATNFTVTPQVDGTVHLNWTAPAAATDGEVAAKYLIYKSTTSPVKEFRQNLITLATIPGGATSFAEPVGFAGNYYYKIVPIDDYNNRGPATQVGPISVLGEPTAPPDLIVDNPQATLTGAWTLASSAADKFGADYRFRGVGTGANKMTFATTIPQAGTWAISEWHSAGSNRAQNARHHVAHAAGSTTVLVNQVTNGGKWNKFAEFTYNSGGTASVIIDDVFTGTVVMADAIKWSYVIQPPAVPTGLSATAASQTQINLTWTDNASNERNTIVARSSAPGGPYADIATLGINQTSFNDTGLTAGTTYYYVVRQTNSVGSSGNSAEASAATLPNPPTAPSGLVATADGQTEIDLSWTDNSNNESNFVVRRATTSGGPYSDVATLGANVTSYSDTGLSADTTYYYVVRATNTGGNSANSNQASAKTLPYPPAAPAGLSATVVSQTQINLAWSDNSSNESNFIISRSATSGGPYTDIATVAANVTSYSNTGLSADSTYYFVVRATNAGGDSADSNEATATTPPFPPAAPSGLVAAASGQTQINLSWADNSNNEVNFVVARATTSGGPYTDIATLGADATGYSNTGLSAGTTYYYVVRATNSAGNSANSNQASATTAHNPPAAPSGLTATAAGQTQINLSWTDNAGNESNYVVARAATSGGPYSDIATLGANATSYSNTGLAAGTTYYYVVRATNNGGASANSNQASATTQASGLIVDNVNAAVTGANWFTGTGATDKHGSNYHYKSQGTGAQYLTFTPNLSSAGAYDVYEWHPVGTNRTVGAPHVINFSGGSDTVLVNQQVNGGTWNLVGRFNFAAGTAGNVRITDDFADAGQVVMADGIKFVHVGAAVVPNAPTGLTATVVSASQINLSWNDVLNENGYSIARATAAGGPFIEMDTVGQGVTSYSATGLVAGATHYFVVRGRNSAGDSANSNVASGTTPLPPPSIPTNLAATAVSKSQINLTWTDNSFVETNYIVSRSTTAGGPYSDIATLGANVSSYSNTGLAGNTRYYYVVRAINSSGTYGYGNEANALTWPNDIIVDNSNAGFSASSNWSTSTSAGDKYGTNYRYRPTASISDAATWSYTVPQTRSYQVYAWWAAGTNRSKTAPYVVTRSGGTTTVNKNQQTNGGSWQSLGTFSMNAGAGQVQLSCWTTKNYVVIADAIKLVAK